MEKSSRGLKILNAVTVVMMFTATLLVFFYAPRERVMGDVQKIFYFHVPSAWLSFVAFTVTLVAGVLYLRTRNPKWDLLGISSVEVGLLFTVMTLASGSIWARPAWNTWWTWDPRLTSYTIVALIYVAYMMLRQGIEDPERRARFAAVYGIIGFVSVPITYMSIYLWRTIHPALFGTDSAAAKGDTPLTPGMLVVFLFSNLAFACLYTCLLANRLRLERLSDRVEQLKARLMTAG